MCIYSPRHGGWKENLGGNMKRLRTTKYLVLLANGDLATANIPCFFSPEEVTRHLRGDLWFMAAPHTTHGQPMAGYYLWSGEQHSIEKLPQNEADAHAIWKQFQKEDQS
jgi:hypothetical protein